MKYHRMSRVPDGYRVSTLVVVPWSDTTYGLEGYDPRSDYVEHYWLPIMGPTTVVFLRRLAMGLEDWPDGFECSARELSWSLGLGHSGASGALSRIIRRSADFGMTSLKPGGRLLTRRLMPPVSPRMLRRLPAWLQESHREYRAAALAEVTA